jgi:hypothetical protein
MKLKSLLARVQSSLQKLLFKHDWVQTSSFISSNRKYVHEQYYCQCCDSTKHIMKYWNKQPIIKIVKNHEK